MPNFARWNLIFERRYGLDYVLQKEASGSFKETSNIKMVVKEKGWGEREEENERKEEREGEYIEKEDLGEKKRRIKKKRNKMKKNSIMKTEK